MVVGESYGRAVTDAQRLLVDRLDIDDLLVRYATVIDERRWDDLDSVFTDDAVLDYRSAGGSVDPSTRSESGSRRSCPYPDSLTLRFRFQTTPSHESNALGCRQAR